MLFKNKLIIIPILIILLCIIFYPVIFQGKIFSSPDSLNPKAAAIILEKTQKEIGEYLLWQPWIFGGMPTAESFTNTSNLYFLQYIFQILHIPTIIIHLLHFFFAGLGTYILLRYMRISQIIAIVGGAGFMLMPYLVTMEVFGHGSQAMTAAYIPWAFWAALRLFDNQRALDAGILAIILGLQLQRAHVQIAYYTWMLVGALFLYKIILFIIDKKVTKEAIKGSGLFIITTILALGISALVYLPSLQYSAESIRSVGQPGSASYDYATSWSFHPKEIITFLIPSGYGFGGQTYWGKMPFTDYPNYMGIIFLLLSLFAIFKVKNTVVWFLSGTGLLALLISFGSHFGFIYNIFYDFAPYFNKFRIPSMILIILQFNVIILACYGLEALAEYKWEGVPKWFWRTTALIGLLILTLLLGQNWIREIVSNGFTQVRTSDMRVVEAINELRWKIWIKDAWIVLLFTAGLLGAVFLFIRNNINKIVFMMIIGILTIIDLIVIDYRIVQPAANSGRSSQLVNKNAIERYFQHDKITEYLSDKIINSRVYPIGPLFGESRLQAFGIESVGGYHPAKLGIYSRFLSNTNNISTLPLMRMMNIHYILSPQVINHPALEHILTDNMQTSAGRIPIWIYRIADSLPRAWFVDNVEVADEDDLWSNLMSDSFDPFKTAYVNEAVTGQFENQNATIVGQYLPNYLKLETNNVNNGFLVISEIHYPLRWKAKIDGEVTNTYQTNGIIRGIVVPSGEHVIEFEYDRSVFNKGIFISIISFVLAIGLIGISLIKTKKEQ